MHKNNHYQITTKNGTQYKKHVIIYTLSGKLINQILKIQRISLNDMKA